MDNPDTSNIEQETEQRQTTKITQHRTFKNMIKGTPV
jgi:hypothetical protein